MSTRVPTPGSGPAAMLTDVIRRQALSEDRITQIGADLAEIGARGLDTHDLVQRLQQRLGELVDAVQTLGGATDDLDEADDRSEERRVGKERRARGKAYEKKNRNGR